MLISQFNVVSGGQFAWIFQFGKKLRQIRETKGFKTRQFADLTEIAYSQVWVLENGKGNPSLTTLMIIVKVLEVSIDELVPQ